VPKAFKWIYWAFVWICLSGLICSAVMWVVCGDSVPNSPQWRLSEASSMGLFICWLIWGWGLGLEER
jgi:hypothetical protein